MGRCHGLTGIRQVWSDSALEWCFFHFRAKWFEMEEQTWVIATVNLVSHLEKIVEKRYL